MERAVNRAGNLPPGTVALGGEGGANTAPCLPLTLPLAPFVGLPADGWSRILDGQRKHQALRSCNLPKAGHLTRTQVRRTPHTTDTSRLRHACNLRWWQRNELACLLGEPQCHP